jgi:hypothetical protein
MAPHPLGTKQVAAEKKKKPSARHLDVAITASNGASD